MCSWDLGTFIHEALVLLQSMGVLSRLVVRYVRDINSRIIIIIIIIIIITLVREYIF